MAGTGQKSSCGRLQAATSDTRIKEKQRLGKYGKTIILIYGKHDNKHVNIMQYNVQA